MNENLKEAYESVCKENVRLREALEKFVTKVSELAQQLVNENDTVYTNYSNMVCPHCGSSNLVFITATSVPFEINPDGTMGRPVLDDEGMECINECASDVPSDIEAYCRHCHMSFSVLEHEDGFELGDAI